jgi:aspartyl/asparaginyl beta-hydroxylase (cupin superfamily)
MAGEVTAQSGAQVSAEVDDLVRAGALAEAAEKLEALLTASEASTQQWLKLAGLRRALRQPHRALDAVHQALALAPLDFMALVMRAGLLERLDRSEAGRAWDNALAQRPEAELAPPLARAVSTGEALRDAWLSQREAALNDAASQALAQASADEALRIGRFQSNILGKTKVYRSEPSHYHWPGLAECEFHPRERFPWLTAFEAATPAIRAELEALMRSERAELVPYLQYESHEPLAQWRELNRNLDWTAIHLIDHGQRIDANADQCPQTMELLKLVDQPRIPGAGPTAMFSLLAPGKVIPPHTGVNNARLLCHLPLIVPDGCWFRVGAETRHWQEGEGFVFDDTIEHEAANPSDRLRVVMIFDLWNPDLSKTEQNAIASIIAADGAPAGGT